ncbi:hypothetical protein Q31b_44930 [Novipirellula aureliae]|uniref:AtpZ/AtpI family protein n=2 Tax=Novipirellula aureliae TaxID=2527966 RepID=A0A5C6DND9_9BACT|nr:hypothetical protein Q31b_44930 [Novipirellula aureliae]
MTTKEPESNSERSDLSKSESPTEKKANRNWVRFAGMGIELAGTTLLFTAVGYWIDDWRDADRPFVTAGAMLVGFSLAMTRFIIVAVKAGP